MSALPRSRWSEAHYRVSTTYTTPVYGLHGWNSRSELFATKEEADIAFDAPLTGSDWRREMHEVLMDRLPPIGRRLRVRERPRRKGRTVEEGS